MASLSKFYPEELILGKIMVNYENEDAIDAGGVTRDWYNKVPIEIFDPKNYFWIYTECGMMPAVESIFIPNYLLHFEYMGRFVALAFFDNQNIGFSFTPCLIKQILGQSVSYEDFQASFPDYYRDLKKLLDMKENDGVEELMKNF